MGTVRFRLAHKTQTVRTPKAVVPSSKGAVKEDRFSGAIRVLTKWHRHGLEGSRGAVHRALASHSVARLHDSVSRLPLHISGASVSSSIRWDKEKCLP